jgi:hypothetical protein
MASKNIIKINKFTDTRWSVFSEEDGVENKYYSVGEGNRWYSKPLSSTQSGELKSADFTSFLSFTMSGTSSYLYELIPLLENETVMVETRVLAINNDNTYGYMAKTFGGYKHTGTISTIGPQIDLDVKSDFTYVSCELVPGTQSIWMQFDGEAGQDLEWNIHLHYTKGFHSPSGEIIYPPKK